MLRVADEPVLDIGRFLRGFVELHPRAQCALLCPVRGRPLPITAAELALTMALPADRWLTSAEWNSMDERTQVQALELAGRGLLLSDPAPADWKDLVRGEQVLEQTHWHDLAAVYHSHSRWEGVVGEGQNASGGLSLSNPPAHFVRRPDADERLSLNIPALEGPFFEALLARRTTRAFQSVTPLPAPALEAMLYTVFGTHGLQTLAPGICAIKRTSPSGGALHPIEAYVLAINVSGIPAGLYHYETAAHALARLERLDLAGAQSLASVFVAGQDYFAESHALVIHVARFERNFWKYSRHRKAYKVVLMDSAHLSQTFYLTAAHLGLGAFYTSAINDVDIGRRLKLEAPREAAVAINGVGLADSTRNELNFVPEPYLVQGDCAKRSVNVER